VTSYIDKQLVPFGDILVEIIPGNRFPFYKNNFTLDENATSTKEV
jgi:hypothetical protein